MEFFFAIRGSLEIDNESPEFGFACEFVEHKRYLQFTL